MANNTVLPEIQYRADFIGKSSFFIRSQFLHPFQLTLHLQQKAMHEKIFAKKNFEHKTRFGCAASPASGYLGSRVLAQLPISCEWIDSRITGKHLPINLLSSWFVFSYYTFYLLILMSWQIIIQDMSDSRMFQRVESGLGPIFKVVLECLKRCSEPFLIYIYGIQCDFMPKSCWKHSNFENR